MAVYRTVFNRQYSKKNTSKEPCNKYLHIVYWVQEIERNVSLKKLSFILSLIVVLALVISSPIFNTKAAAGFTDVNDRYKEAVDHMVEQGYTKGIGATQYGTDNQITRLDAAVMIAKVLGFNESSTTPSAGFTDVPDNRAWAVDALFKAGVINGKTATSFGSYQNMTRGEMAIVLSSAYKLSASSDSIPFTDVNPRYVSAVAALVEAKITNGKGTTKFGTNDNITRGEFAIFIFKGDNLSKDLTPPEVISVD